MGRLGTRPSTSIVILVAAVVVAGVLVTVAALWLNRPSTVEKAVARHLDVAASDVNCDRSPRDALPHEYYCEVDSGGDLKACYEAFVDPETGKVEEVDTGSIDPETQQRRGPVPGVFKIGESTGDCETVFDQFS